MLTASSFNSMERMGRMQTKVQKQAYPFRLLLWFSEGIVAGFGAILPGVSGGTLCVAFGMYRPIIECLSNPKTGIKKHLPMLGTFLLGIAVGFAGLSGFAAFLLERNAILVTCVFVGFVMGTFPDLWQDAGKEGRKYSSYFSLIFGFAFMLLLLFLLNSRFSLVIAPNGLGFLLCGILWGLSFLVPGLSSSSLLLFFGLYAPMSAGIYRLDLHVLLPMGFGMAGCVFLLSGIIGRIYQKHYATISHGVLGITAATTAMLLPFSGGDSYHAMTKFLFIACGAAVSCCFRFACKKIENTSK